MKFRPRQSAATSSSRGRRLSTVIIVVAVLSILLLSPDVPAISRSSFRKSTRPAEPLPGERPQDSRDTPLTPAQISQIAEREARDIAEKEKKSQAAHLNGAASAPLEPPVAPAPPAPPADNAKPLAADAQPPAEEQKQDPALRSGDYVKNELVDEHEASANSGEQKAAEEANAAPVAAAERQEAPKAEQQAVNTERKTEPVMVPAPAAEAQKACLQHIVYDKPVKTGSTAVTKALKTYLDARGAKYYDCTFDKCTSAAKEVCAGRMEKTNLVEHMLGDEDAVNCLGRNGYYKVTSIREPLERWESSFLYNRGKKASHYGIPYEASYEEFMSKYPACSLFDYYDGLGKRCEMAPISLDERIRKIVDRYDEIIDLYNDDVQGQLHKRLQRNLNEENKSSRPKHDFRMPIDLSRLQNETRLYNALKRRQKELLNREPQLC